MNFLFYLIQVNLYLILFYSFYRLILFGETFHQLNRLYLVVSALLSFGIPLWYSAYVQSWFITKEINEVFYAIYDPSMILIRPTKGVSFTWADILRGLYIVGISVFSIRLLITLLQLTVVLKNKDFERFSAFSFFGYSFVDEALKKRETILAHEHVHIRQLHSADVMIFEVIAILNWFNPIVYQYKKDIKHIHEFIADEVASQNEESKADYALLLFTQEFGLQPDQLTNRFFTHSTLKRRIQMLSKPRSHKIMLLKYGLSVPLFILMLVFSSATIARNQMLGIVEGKLVGLAENNLSFKTFDSVTTQDALVQGRITSETDGQALQGVSVTLVNKERGTITNANGEFKINAAPDDELRISLTGFETTIVPVDNKTVLNIVLKAKEKTIISLEEIKVKINKNTTDEHDDSIFESVEENPLYPGGLKEMYAFIANNLKYPVEAHRNNISGKVFIKFVVKKDGSLSNLKVLKGIGYGCDEETVRVISQMPKWQPGKQNGKPVNVMFTMPVNFLIEEDDLARIAPPKLADNIRNPDKTRVKRSGVKNPIVIMDGVEVNVASLDEISTAKIEKIEVLKDELATRIYGVRAINGVVLITSKKPLLLNEPKANQPKD